MKCRHRFRYGHGSELMSKYARVLYFAESPDKVRENLTSPKAETQEKNSLPELARIRREQQEHRQGTETAARDREAASLKSLEQQLVEPDAGNSWSKSSEQKRQPSFAEGQAILNKTCGPQANGRWTRVSTWGPFRHTLEVLFDDGMWKTRWADMLGRADFVDASQTLGEYAGTDGKVRDVLESLSRLNRQFPGPFPNPFERIQENGRIGLRRKPWEFSELSYRGQRLAIDGNTGQKTVTTDDSGRVGLMMSGKLPGKYSCFAAEIDPSTGQPRLDSSFSFQKLTMKGADIDALLAPSVKDATIGIWIRGMVSLESNAQVANNEQPLVVIHLKR